MKSLMLTILLAATMGLQATTPDKRDMKKVREHVELPYDLFKKYLEIGSPHQLEGVYTSPDGRYQMALIKHKTKEHDFIGVIMDADNPYWQEGEVKFSFRLERGKLYGNYFDDNRNANPFVYKLKRGQLKNKHWKKVALETITEELAQAN